MLYCQRCIQPDTRPGIIFDSEGICPPCRFAEKHNAIDWAARRRELEMLADFGRKNNISGYDCIVAVSGGKDSMRQAMYLKDELGLKPLLVCQSYPPEQQTERGASNLGLLISQGFDCIMVSPDPVAWKKMLRQGFLLHGNWAKSSEMALYASIPKFAIAYQIPLICYGENPAIALGALEVGDASGDASQLRNSFTLKGGPESVKTPDITLQDLYWYYYPSEAELQWAKLKIFFLGYYIKDFTRFENSRFSIEQGLQIRHNPPSQIGDVLGAEALDDDFVIVNQMLKYFKYGFGKASDQLCEAIRLGYLTRAEAVTLARKYDGQCAPYFIKKFCQYLEISQQQFWEVANKYRNPQIWQKDSRGEWFRKAVLV